MLVEQELQIEGAQIDFEFDNVPFMDGQFLKETCVIYESPRDTTLKEEDKDLQYSVELH